MNKKIDEYSGAFLLEVLKEFVLFHTGKEAPTEEFWTNKIEKIQKEKDSNARKDM